MASVETAATTASSSAKFTSTVVSYCEDDFFMTFRLRPGRVLGRGVSGPVVLASPYNSSKGSKNNKTTDATFSSLRAVKLIKIHQDQNEQRQQERFAEEVSIMNGLNHPHLMCQVTAAMCPRYFAISMRYCPNGSLDRVLKRQGHQPLSPAMLDRYTVELSCAVRYLHQAGVYHGDIKLENILVADNRGLVLCDFSHSQVLINGERSLSRFAGTAPYIAPEVDGKQEVDAFKLDAFSVGVVIWCLVTGKNACGYQHKHFAPMLDMTPSVSCALYKSLFVPNLLTANPKARWTVTLLCHHLKMSLDFMQTIIDSL